MNICLYFGSFNPIHKGHHSLARHILLNYDFDFLYFVLSPLNPHKTAHNTLPFEQRLQFISQAIADEPRMKVCTLEDILPFPHYSIRTLRALHLLEPQNKFALLIGADNYLKIDTWYHSEEIAQLVELYIYPREGYQLTESTEGLWQGKRTICHQAPLFPYSSTEIRLALEEDEEREDLLPSALSWTEVREAFAKL